MTNKHHGKKEDFLQHDFLYHKSCGDSKDKVRGSIEKSGLMSYSTIGRHGEDEDNEGNCLPLPNEHRIWFQTELNTGFDSLDKLDKKSDKCVVLRLSNKYFPDNTEIWDDDQFSDEKHQTVYISDTDQFSIPPDHLEELIDGKWKSLSSNKYQSNNHRSLIDQISPWIKKDFIEKKLDVNDDDDMQLYLNSECHGNSLYEECNNKAKQWLEDENIDADYDESTKEFEFEDNNDKEKFESDFPLDCKKYKGI